MHVLEEEEGYIGEEGWVSSRKPMSYRIPTILCSAYLEKPRGFWCGA